MVNSDWIIDSSYHHLPFPHHLTVFVRLGFFNKLLFFIQIKLIDTISEMADRYDNGCANHIILTGPNGLRNHRVTVEEEHRTGFVKNCRDITSKMTYSIKGVRYDSFKT